ncbi:MAG: ATP synthase F1 subunit epsilon [Prolixibacteraceae bacterium]|jgi:F-type H+-transporting ATPase subunit epsilon|nr:ATP synthase F1 subunit epsilon [Prolixibacteraceae bacterium]MDI9564019.1 ATP synthase F1 subunit epsilon [Bacteroidota bacterium]NLS99129.1 ATP synthase F1 subunit epsilon [Bacteroidales bacterium]OQB82142.1 MAG: ATP synthase epsilon chain [Bacteroidetes bacterium ADurb.Bin123]HNU77780.1 ATP synthase F1 subunit epsilon [Prolixibacteraceae bacterium]
MLLEIISPDKIIYSGEVTLVQLPGTKSSFEILKNHAHIISTLKKGTIRLIETGGTEKTFPVDGGLVENENNKIVVLTGGF